MSCLMVIYLRFVGLLMLSNLQMNTILGERQSKPSYDVLSSIVNAEALNISAQWLLTGKGEMFKSSSPKEELTPITNERLLSIIESQQRTIENLSKK